MQRLALHHSERARRLLIEHAPQLADSAPLLEALTDELQNTFDAGFRAAGGEIADLRPLLSSTDGANR